MDSPAEEKCWRRIWKDLLFYRRSRSNWVACSRIQSRRNPRRLYERARNLQDPTATFDSRRHVTPRKKVWKEMVHRVASMSEKYGKLRNMSTSLMTRTRPRSSHLLKCGHCQHILDQTRGKTLLEYHCTCWAGEIWTKLNWRLVRVSRTLQRFLQLMEKCRQMRKATVYVYDLSWQYQSSTLRFQPYRWENSAKITDIHISDQWSKSTSHLEWQNLPMQHRKRIYRSLCQDYQPVHPARAQVHLLHRYKRTQL